MNAEVEFVTLEDERRRRDEQGGQRDKKVEPPRPLMRELPAPDPFPIEALGDLLAPAAAAIQDRVQAAPAICAQSALAVATVAVQAHADIELPTKQRKPVSNFYLSIAGTGDRKTAADTEASRPLRKREAALREMYRKELPSYLNAKFAWEKARKEATKGLSDPAEIKSALDAIGPTPTPPLQPLLTCQEPTYEGLCKYFADGWPSMGIFTTEGGQFLGGHGMADDAKLRTAAGLSALWDGEPLARVRAGERALVMPGRRIAVHLMAQPDVAAIALNDPLLASQGLLSRWLITAPTSLAGTRMWHDPSANSDHALKRYGARLTDILETPLPLAKGKTNELIPRLLPLAAVSRRLWIGFADHVEKAIRPGGELEPVRGLANKLPEHAARMAAVLTLVKDLTTTEVSSTEMEAGIELAQHYAAEALRLFDGSRIHPDLLLAQRLLAWLHMSWTEEMISLPDIYQRSLNAIRDQATARKLVGVLEQHGWLPG
jgi:hypothetical protein